MADDDQRDPTVPPVGEEIHLPSNSVLPLVLAVGITLALIGITTFIGFVIAGALITLYAIARWVRETRAEIEELPPEHH